MHSTLDKKHSTMTTPILEVENLRTRFHTDDGTLVAVDDISFEVNRGETVCIVGESGSGKSVTSESITKILPIPPGEISQGHVRFDGLDLSELSDSELKEIRGNRIAHIFQNPQGGLNPVYTIGKQIQEAIHLHEDVSAEEARTRTVELLDKVGIPEPASNLDSYPHQISGGQKQRVMIAMALACQPELLIADEPTTALDVTIQANILQLLDELQDEFGMSIIFITHDLGVVSKIADRVLVMYAGKILERGPVHDIYNNPGHPYTKALMDCLPGRGSNSGGIPGTLPDLTDPPSGCRFHPRCEYAIDDCRGGEHPPEFPVDGKEEHTAACIFRSDEYDSSVIEGNQSDSTTSPTSTKEQP